ncbi:MAG: HAD-IC family P-type ATPase [Aquificota bacterium]|nr:HAD-IC family P-type ATPase [Aquificota bacterium]
MGCKELIGKGIVCGDYFIGGYDSQGDCYLKTVALRKGEKVLALFYLKDTLRQEAKHVVGEIKKMGIKTLLLSGDRMSSTKLVAEELGFDDFVAEVKPEEKREFIRSLQDRGLRVAMVGDGLNDAPALAQADLSFAVAGGADITKQTGDIVLLSGIGSLPTAFRLGLTVNRKIKQNLLWAFLYNVVGIPLAAGLLFRVWSIS